jgi:diguanylate cyclase (GGDEF)-like protein
MMPRRRRGDLTITVFREWWSAQKITLVFSVLVLLMVAALLVWTGSIRYRDFETHQQELMKSSVEGTAGEIGIFINELRRGARLFADIEGVRLERLMRDPDNTVLYDAIQKSVKTHFPDAFAFTIADKNGKPFVTDFEGRIGETCVNDVRRFVSDRSHSGIYVHPNQEMYHFDIMVEWERNGQRFGIFFISFSTDILARILKHGQIPGHRLMLLRQNIPGLIEIAAGGARIALDREFKLTAREMHGIGYSVPVGGTFWDLADLPEPGLFENARTGLWREAVMLMSAFVLVSVLMAGVLFRAHARNRELEYLYTHDPATGFPNRYFLLDRLQRCAHSARQEKFSFALLLIDLGEVKRAGGAFFNRHNDDALVREAGERMQKTLRASDVLARLAGSEYAVLMYRTAAEEAAGIASGLLENLKTPFAVEANAKFPRVCIGLAVFPEHGTDAEALLQHAGAALYAAKLKGSGFAVYAQAP